MASASGTGAPDSIENANYDQSKIIVPEASLLCSSKSLPVSVVKAVDGGSSTHSLPIPPSPPTSNKPITVSGLDAASSSDKENGFDLMENEEEERLLGNAAPLPPIDGVLTGRSTSTAIPFRNNVGSSTAPTLRSVSLPKGPLMPVTGSSWACSTSPPLGRATSLIYGPKGNPMTSVNGGNCTLAHPPLTDKKAMKVVSEYYKKQNELLENFKTDNEQIQVFQKTRTRQRLASTNSQEQSDDAGGSAPLLQHTDGEEDVTVITPAKKKVTVEEGTTVSGGGKDIDPIDLEQNLEDAELLEKTPQEVEHTDRKAASRIAKVTLWVNVLLAIAKAVASGLSGSLSIISSLVDSLVDITSGSLILYSTRAIRKRDPYLYPRGRTRLEPMVLVIISIIMGFASLQLAYEAVKRIYDGDLHINMSWTSAGIMIATVIIKGALVLYCQKMSKNDANIRILAQDHRNDCISNTVALICAAITPIKDQDLTFLGTRGFAYADALGAIGVSLYIMHTWYQTGKEHVMMLSGKSAKPEFINRIIKVCIDHDPRIEHIDTVYVYHYGMKFLVEVHIVLDENMTLKVAHDISESLQINIESLPDVERAFVHTDYEYEHLPEDEHKVV